MKSSAPGLRGQCRGGRGPWATERAHRDPSSRGKRPGLHRCSLLLETSSSMWTQTSLSDVPPALSLVTNHCYNCQVTRQKKMQLNPKNKLLTKIKNVDSVIFREKTGPSQDGLLLMWGGTPSPQHSAFRTQLCEPQDTRFRLVGQPRQQEACSTDLCHSRPRGGSLGSTCWQDRSGPLCLVCRCCLSRCPPVLIPQCGSVS